MSGSKKLFLSAVSSEFISYRNLLADDLKRPNLDVAVQEDFIVTGGSTLEKLDTYISHCDGVIHLIGKATGSVPEEPAVAALLARLPDLAQRLPPLAPHLARPQPGLSYTQWEAYLALYHERPLFLYRTTDFDSDGLDVPRGPEFVLNAGEAQSQRDHYRRICTLGHDRGEFSNAERLSSFVLRDLVDILPILRPFKPIYIRPITDYSPAQLIDREGEIRRLKHAWQRVCGAKTPRRHVLTFVALGGEGKTSIVAKWVAELAHHGWRGCDAVFAWSFHSQGIREQVSTSVDLFLKEALTVLGDYRDRALAASSAGSLEKGQRLAEIVGGQCSLLILDGLEPLQRAPTADAPGQLKDMGITALLKKLASTSKGLCVVTTRYSLPDLRTFWQTTAPEVQLGRLSRQAGVDLLQRLGVKGSNLQNIPSSDGKEKLSEYEKLVEEVKGHALTLALLGTYLRDAHGGDIRRRGLVGLEEANAEEEGGHAFRVIEAYERALAGEGDRGQRALALLRLLGLFDRPATADCLAALLQAPAIAGLTEPLAGVTHVHLNVALARLEQARLLAVNRDGAGGLVSLDAHALVREYFAQQLRTWQPAAWRMAHERLYEHLRTATRDKAAPVLDDLEPLYQAVAHGCRAGLFRDALEKVFVPRIRRDGPYAIEGGPEEPKHYSIYIRGAFSSDLSALFGFVSGHRVRAEAGLPAAAQAYVLNEIGSCLRAAGRLAEAPPYIEEALRLREEMGHSHRASSARDLAAACIALGRLGDAVTHARRATELADVSLTRFERYGNHCWLGRALHLTGNLEEAGRQFREAKQRAGGTLVGLQAAFFADLLIDRGLTEEAIVVARNGATTKYPRDNALCQAMVAEAQLRKHFGRTWPTCPSSADKGLLQEVATQIEDAVRGLRTASRLDEVPIALLLRARLLYLQENPEGAKSDLADAWDISERGPMWLHMADVHLHRARLFFREKPYPWGSAEDDLAAAKRLVEQCGYHRRDEELDDAKRAILGQ